MDFIQQAVNFCFQKFSKQPSNRAFRTKQSSYISIPIRPHQQNRRSLPIHISHSKIKTKKLTKPVIMALGGITNIESYREIPNSRRIRLTITNPSLIDSVLLEEIDVRMFIRIGKRIVHIIP